MKSKLLEKTDARMAKMRKILAGREMTAGEIAREMNFSTVNAFQVWLGGERVSHELPLYETDTKPIKYGLLGSGGKR